MRAFGWRLSICLAVAVFLRFVFAGDGWRAFGIFFVLVLLLFLRDELVRGET